MRLKKKVSDLDWEPLQRRQIDRLTTPYKIQRGLVEIDDTGYPHDGRADNAAYWHDRRADKRRYRHDREIDIQNAKCLENGFILS